MMETSKNIELCDSSEPLRVGCMFWRNEIMENHPNTNEEVNYTTSPTQGMLTTAYRYLDIPMKKYT